MYRYECLPAGVSVQHGHAYFTWRPEQGTWSPGTGVTNGWKSPCECWELNSDPLEEQTVAITHEPFLQSHGDKFN